MKKIKSLPTYPIFKLAVTGTKHFFFIWPMEIRFLFPCISYCRQGKGNQRRHLRAEGNQSQQEGKLENHFHPESQPVPKLHSTPHGIYRTFTIQRSVGTGHQNPKGTYSDLTNEGAPTLSRCHKSMCIATHRLISKTFIVLITF